MVHAIVKIPVDVIRDILEINVKFPYVMDSLQMIVQFAQIEMVLVLPTILVLVIQAMLELSVKYQFALAHSLPTLLCATLEMAHALEIIHASVDRDILVNPAVLPYVMVFKLLIHLFVPLATEVVYRITIAYVTLVTLETVVRFPFVTV